MSEHDRKQQEFIYKWVLSALSSLTPDQRDGIRRELETYMPQYCTVMEKSR